MMLLAANSERQLGHEKEAEAIYTQIVAKYPNRDEAKDAQLPAPDQHLQFESERARRGGGSIPHH